MEQCKLPPNPFSGLTFCVQKYFQAQNKTFVFLIFLIFSFYMHFEKLFFIVYLNYSTSTEIILAKKKLILLLNSPFISPPDIFTVPFQLCSLIGSIITRSLKKKTKPLKEKQQPSTYFFLKARINLFQLY